MAATSLAIDWGSIGDDDNDILEVVVVPSSATTTTSPTPTPTCTALKPELASLPDRDLRENITPLRGFLNDTTLLKDGDKLRINLSQCEHELLRRQTTPFPKENTSLCHSYSTTRELLNQGNDGFSFKKSYESLSVNKFYGKGEVAFEDDLSRLGRDRCNMDKGKNIQASKATHFRSFSDRGHNRVKGENQKSSRKVSFKSPSNRIRRLVHSAGYKDLSGYFFTKKRKVSKSENPLDSDSEKVKDVVLLDDDDVEISELTSNKEIPDGWNKMYYPSRNDPEAIELGYSDIKCLQPCEYLSSPVMNFYIQYLKQFLCQTSRSIQSFYIFNTYFYQKLEEAFDGKDELSSSFTRLRRWWKGVNIFEKAYIMLPIHGRLHWSLVIICIPEEESQSGPIILHLDSLGCHSSSAIFKTIECYLKKEWHHVAQSNSQSSMHQIQKEKVSGYNTKIDLKENKEIKRIAKYCDANQVPLQNNEYDCGLFVLYFIERFIVDAPDRFANDNLAMFSQQWFKPEEASSLRQRIRHLLIENFESVRTEEDETRGLKTVSCSSDSD